MVFISCILVKLMKVSPAMGNFMMDVLGEERYLRVLELAKRT